MLVTLGAAFLPTLIVGGLLPAGGLFLAGLLTFNRGALESLAGPAGIPALAAGFARASDRRRNVAGQLAGDGL